MRLRKLAFEVGTVFGISLVTVSLVTFLWNIMAYGKSAIDWDISFCFAIIFGVFATLTKLQKNPQHDSKEKLDE
jgi:Na+-translocating ferredoxin:NAD+ oxidoreductase RnfD subunit